MPAPVSAFNSDDEAEHLTPLEAHHRGYLRAFFADRHDEAEYHWAQIELIERGHTTRPDTP